MKRLLFVSFLLAGLLVTASCASAASELGLDKAAQFENSGSRPESPPQATLSAPDGVRTLDADPQRMIVRTADVRLIVQDTAAAITRITRLAEESNGYVVSSNMWKEGERLVGAISIRVPAESFNNAMSTLRALADEVTYDKTTADDVTEEYFDLSAKLKNLEATEAQLLEIMKKAESIEDILAVQRQLDSTRSEIERNRGRINYLEQTSETSLISVQLTQSKLDVEIFATSARYIKGGGTVNFKANVVGGFAPYTYRWDFGDKSTSTEETPAHAYRASGKFTVSLTVTDDRDNAVTDTRNDYITVASGWSPGVIAGNAWTGLKGFSQVLADIIIWLGIFSPVWLIGGALVYWLVKGKNREKFGWPRWLIKLLGLEN